MKNPEQGIATVQTPRQQAASDLGNVVINTVEKILRGEVEFSFRGIFNAVKKPAQEAINKGSSNQLPDNTKQLSDGTND